MSYIHEQLHALAADSHGADLPIATQHIIAGAPIVPPKLLCEFLGGWSFQDQGPQLLPRDICSLQAACSPFDCMHSPDSGIIAMRDNPGTQCDSNSKFSMEFGNSKLLEPSY